MDGHECNINREACFEIEFVHLQRTHDTYGCYVVETSADKEESTEVVDALFNPSSYANTPTRTVTTATGLHFYREQDMFMNTHTNQCSGLKTCPMHGLPTVPRKGDELWTCTVLGDLCTLPFVFNDVFVSACTQQRSHQYDADQDGLCITGTHSVSY